MFCPKFAGHRKNEHLLHYYLEAKFAQIERSIVKIGAVALTDLNVGLSTKRAV